MGRILKLAAAALAVGVSLAPAAAPPAPAVAAINAPGSPFLTIGAFDLKALGYVVEEYIVSGAASAYKLSGPPTADGAWTAQPTDTAPYATRMVVIRPADPKKFSGAVAVEWLNVTGGLDAG